MRRSRALVRTLIPCAGLAAAALAAASVPFSPTTAGAQARECFRTNNWQGTSAGGPHDLYVRININDIWHLAMAQECPGARFPGPVSISDIVSGGTNQICSGVDLQIMVKPRGSGVQAACIVTSIRKLTPDEVKALPKKAIPD